MLTHPNEGAEIPSTEPYVRQPSTAWVGPRLALSHDPNGRAAQWRKRADELRAIADAFNHAQARDDLLKLAEQWEAMADREERRLGVDRPDQRP